MGAPTYRRPGHPDPRAVLPALLPLLVAILGAVAVLAVAGG